VLLPATLNIYLEDRLILRPYASGRWSEQRREGEDSSDYGHGWNWEYGVVFNYRLDGTLF
jgi:hypothetical protein